MLGPSGPEMARGPRPGLVPERDAAIKENEEVEDETPTGFFELVDDLRFGGEVGVALASSKPRFDLAWRQVRFGRESVDIRIGPEQMEIDHF